jgi:outer membrane receptor protein involved in Fe transport
MALGQGTYGGSNVKTKLIREVLLASTIVAGMAFATPSFAQTADATAEKQEEVVVVTGTRVARPNLQSTVPVASFSAEQIQSTGELNVADVARTLPAIGVSALSGTNSNFLTAGAGINTLQLRNLGESRTLILINGRRVVSGSPGTQSVDLNTIPTEFIERLDVVTGGASAVYGSDALAGVINVVTKKSFDGIEFSAQKGQSFEFGDDERERYSLTFGSNFADDRGSAAFNVTRDTSGAVRAADRPTMDGDFSWNFPTSGDLSQFVGPAFSSFIPQGRIILPTNRNGGTVNRVVQDDGSVTPYVATRDGFNRNAQRLLLVPTERLLVATQLNFELNKNVELYAEATVARTSTESSYEAVPYSSEDVYEDSLPFCGDVDFDGVDDNRCAFGVPLTNPLIPNAIKAEVRAALPGISDENLVVGFARRLNEIANRGNESDRETFRAVTGARGVIGNSNVNYDISMTYGVTTDFQVSNGDVDNVKFGLALDAITDATGAVVCRDPAARAAGCVPINVFGRNKISEAAATYVGIQTNRYQRAEQFVLNGYVTGDAFELPGGTSSFVFGGEYRFEDQRDIPDPLTQSGGASGNATPATFGNFDVTEIFGELRLPILADKPFVKELNLNLAARASKYSTVGETLAYAASLEYAPVDWLRFRTQYARAVRAPNVSELFQPATQDFPNVSDPCAGVTRTSTGQAAFKTVRGGDGAVDPALVLASPINTSTIGNAVAVNCLADPAVLARVTRDGALALTQPEAQGVSGFDGGSANLGAETSDSVTAGFVFRPTFIPALENLSVTVDYYKIKIDDVISVLNEQLSADQCYGSASGFNAGSVFCSNIVRFANGPSVGALRFVNQLSQNLAQRTAEGVDVQASYRFAVGDLPFLPEGDFGDVALSLIYSHVMMLQDIPYSGASAAEISNDEGTIGASKNEAVLNVAYSLGDFSLNWEAQFIGKAAVTNDTLGGTNYGTTIGGRFIRAEVDAQQFHNVSARYELTPRVTIYGGVDNVFDEYVLFGGTQVPPGPNPPQANRPTGWSTFPDVYDGLRRRGYVGVRLKF